jgi:hypothetical protein
MTKLRSLKELKKAWPDYEAALASNTVRRADELMALRTDALAEFHVHQARVAELSRLLHQIDERVNELKGKEPMVTDHAVVQYLRRHHGLDIDQLRHEIAGKIAECKRLEAAHSDRVGIKTMAHEHPSGLRLIVDERGVVVTCFYPYGQGKSGE